MSRGETKARILDAAERLFAERGIDGSSLRAVTREAEVNLAAVHYHLGSKQALLEAVMARRIDPVNQARLERLEELEGAAQGNPVAVEELLGAFLEPALRLVANKEGGLLFARMMCRAYWEAGESFRDAVVSQFRGVGERFGAALAQSLAPMPLTEVFVRFQYMLGVMIHELADPQRLRRGGPFEIPEADLDTRLARLVTFLAAGFRAPVESAPHREDSP
jgi:AcrR family transcriptional regulator